MLRETPAMTVRNNLGELLSDPTRLSLRTLMVLMLTVLAGCVTDDINLRVERLEKQIIGLEDRIEDLEAAQKAEKKARDNSVPAPCVNRGTLQGRIESLQNKRAALLIKYTNQHPDIVELDRKIQLAQDQIRMLNTAGTSCSGTSATQQ